MGKCIFCGKPKEGFICKHCIAKGSSNVGKLAKPAVKYVFMLGSAVIVTFITNKISKKGDKDKD
jgi:hypothetical protein